MKRIVTFLSLLAFAFCMLAPMQISAQSADTLWIAASPAGNINSVINADTTSTGVRQHLYYGLHRGLTYYYTSTIIVNGSFTLVGEPATTSVSPAVIAPAILADNSSPDTFFKLIGNNCNVTMKNIYLLNVRPDMTNSNNWATGIMVKGDKIALNLDKVYFDAMSNAAVNGSGNYDKYIVKNCTFRNNQHATSWFGGEPFIMMNVPLDTIKIVNNTFFCNNAYVLATSDYETYTLIEHNTVFLTTVNPLNIFNSYNAIIRNNIFYGTEAEGQTKLEMSQYYFENRPDQISSIISVDTAAIRNGMSVKNLDPYKRTFKVNNNAYYWPQAFADFYKSYNDTVKHTDNVNGQDVKSYLYPSAWMNGFTDTLFHHTTGYTNLDESNNFNTDPGFDQSITQQITPLLNYVLLTRQTKLVGGATYWLYNTTSSSNPFQGLFPPVWPLPENLAYTNTTLQHAGTDGYALGDLNWFPAQYAQWIKGQPLAVGESNQIPTQYALSQNYPNPFNPTTTISFTIPAAEKVVLKVYDMIGREITTLVNEERAAGSHKVIFNASKLSSGVYFYTISAGKFFNTKKLILLK